MRHGGTHPNSSSWAKKIPQSNIREKLVTWRRCSLPKCSEQGFRRKKNKTHLATEEQRMRATLGPNEPPLEKKKKGAEEGKVRPRRSGVAVIWGGGKKGQAIRTKAITYRLREPVEARGSQKGASEQTKIKANPGGGVGANENQKFALWNPISKKYGEKSTPRRPKTTKDQRQATGTEG